MEKKSIEVIIGKSVEGTVDEAKIGAGLNAAPKGDAAVGGRYMSAQWIECPYDGAMNLCDIDSDQYLYFRCWRDGQLFRA